MFRDSPIMLQAIVAMLSISAWDGPQPNKAKDEGVKSKSESFFIAHA